MKQNILNEVNEIRQMMGLINEQNEKVDGETITKLIINPNRMGSSVTLSNGKTYQYSEGNNLKFPTIGYSYQCKPGEYNGNQLPQYCSVSITMDQSGKTYTYDSKKGDGFRLDPTRRPD